MTSLQTRFYLTFDFYRIRNKARLISFSVTLLFFFNSCDLIGVKCIKYGKSSTGHEVYVHSVGGFGINDYFTDEYYLVITNYNNNSMTAKDFIDIARSFIDTAHSENPIGDIIFLGQVSGGCMPYENYNERVYEKYGIIEIGFEGSNPENKGNIKELSYVRPYKDGKPSDKFIYVSNPRIKDSILNSKKNINNW